MKIILAVCALGVGLAACAPTPDEYAARPAPVAYQTVVPVVSVPAYPTVVYPAPAAVVTAPVVTPTVVVPVVGSAAPIPRGSGVSVGTSPNPVLSPAQKAQDKSMSGGGSN